MKRCQHLYLLKNADLNYDEAYPDMVHNSHCPETGETINAGETVRKRNFSRLPVKR